MFDTALRFPVSFDDRLRTYVIGSLLIVGSILVIPAIILIGYFTRSIGHATAAEDPPVFGDWVGLFVDGLKLLVVALAYGVAFIALMFVTAFFGAIDDSLAIVALWGLMIPAYFGLAFLATSILYHFSQHRSIRDAFALRTIARTAASLRYVLVIVLWMLVLPLIFTILQLVLTITIVGILLVPATLLYELLMYANLVGSIEG